MIANIQHTHLNLCVLLPAAHRKVTVRRKRGLVFPPCGFVPARAPRRRKVKVVPPSLHTDVNSSGRQLQNNGCALCKLDCFLIFFFLDFLSFLPQVSSLPFFPSFNFHLPLTGFLPGVQTFICCEIRLSLHPVKLVYKMVKLMVAGQVGFERAFCTGLK